jgi:hypothetical protein
LPCPDGLGDTWENTMRKQFVECSSRKQAEKACPWAEKVVKVEGGYWCFESISECESWKKQK